MAPEQTGRMNRSVDTRSDLYALGVPAETLAGRLRPPKARRPPLELGRPGVTKASPSPRLTSSPSANSWFS